MSTPIFPATFSLSKFGLTYPVLRTPSFSTTIQQAPNRFETRILNDDQGLWAWEFEYDFLEDNITISPLVYDDLNAFLGFFLAMRGRYADFLFADAKYFSVGPGLISASPNLFAQLQIVNDGLGHYFSPLQLHIGGTTGTDTTTGAWVDITDLQPAGGADHSALNVYANGVLQTYGSDYTLLGPGLSGPGYSFGSLYLAWTGTPAGPVTATFSFFWRVRWDTDSQDFEQFMDHIYAIGGGHGGKGNGSVRFMQSRKAVI